MFWVGVGGFFGAVGRFALGEWLHTESGFPLGTLVVNLLGCLALGWFLAYAQRRGLRNEVNLLVGTGFLGSFTTFSTFSVESISLITSGQLLLAVSYLGLTLLLGILVAYFGFRLGAKKS